MQALKGGIMKKTLSLFTVLAVTALSCPLTTFAQNQPLTRTQVKEDLKMWEQAGYWPSEDRLDYPKNALKTHEKLWRQGYIK